MSVELTITETPISLVATSTAATQTLTVNDSVPEVTLTIANAGTQGIQGEKGDTGETGLYVVDADFNGNNIDFTLNDASIVTLADAKIELKGDQGNDGYTPIKGVDYFDGDKGDKGDKGDDGYTPIKGVDYFDGAKGDKGDDGYTPVKGIDYFDGDKGDKGDKGDAGYGVALGGSIGQVLTKNSTTDYDTVWQDAQNDDRNFSVAMAVCLG